MGPARAKVKKKAMSKRARAAARRKSEALREAAHAAAVARGRANAVRKWDAEERRLRAASSRKGGRASPKADAATKKVQFSPTLRVTAIPVSHKAKLPDAEDSPARLRDGPPPPGKSISGSSFNVPEAVPFVDAFFDSDDDEEEDGGPDRDYKPFGDADGTTDDGMDVKGKSPTGPQTRARRRRKESEVGDEEAAAEKTGEAGEKEQSAEKPAAGKGSPKKQPKEAGSSKKKHPKSRVDKDAASAEKSPAAKGSPKTKKRAATANESGMAAAADESPEEPAAKRFKKTPTKPLVMRQTLLDDGEGADGLSEAAPKNGAGKKGKEGKKMSKNGQAAPADGKNKDEQVANGGSPAPAISSKKQRKRKRHSNGGGSPAATEGAKNVANGKAAANGAPVKDAKLSEAAVSVEKKSNDTDAEGMSDLDALFAGLSKKKAANKKSPQEKQLKKKGASPLSKHGAGGGIKYTDDGLRVYTMDEIAADQPKELSGPCPFECSCCF